MQRIYLFRNEGLWALQNLRIKNKQESWDTFVKGLYAAFEKSLGPEVTIRNHYLADIEKAVRTAAYGKKTISLDPCISGDCDIRMSRHFSFDSMRDLGLGERPGSPPLEEQIRAIPPGEYVIIEDDIYTGTTIKRLLEIVQSMNPLVTVTKIVSGFQVGNADLPISVSSDLFYQKEEVLDINDPRDFLVGSYGSGLVTRHENDLVRVPYLLPFVNPHDRSSIPRANVAAFSKDIWKLNCDFWERHPETTVKDTELLPLSGILGFKEDTSMVSFCRQCKSTTA